MRITIAFIYFENQLIYSDSGILKFCIIERAGKKKEKC